MFTPEPLLSTRIDPINIVSYLVKLRPATFVNKINGTDLSDLSLVNHLSGSRTRVMHVWVRRWGAADMWVGDAQI